MRKTYEQYDHALFVMAATIYHQGAALEGISKSSTDEGIVSCARSTLKEVEEQIEKLMSDLEEMEEVRVEPRRKTL